MLTQIINTPEIGVNVAKELIAKEKADSYKNSYGIINPVKRRQFSNV